jgi:hypothetical protein
MSTAEIFKSLVEKISAAGAVNFDFFDHSRAAPENGAILYRLPNQHSVKAIAAQRNDPSHP